MDRYEISRPIAKVRHGTVLLCTDAYTGQQVAVKRIRKVASTKKAYEAAASVEAEPMEKQVHRQLSRRGGHPNVLRLLADFEEDGYEHYVLEYCAQGDLFGIVEAAPNRRLDAERTRDYFGQVCDAVMFIHERGFAHMDLSLENVLVDARGNMKVSDFGLAIDINSTQTSPVGKHFYMSPEMLLRTKYEPAKADVWSLGIMLFIMLTGNPLFERAEAGNPVFEYMRRHGLKAIIRAWQLDKFVSPSALDLLEKMLVIDPSQRYSMQEVMDHEYLEFTQASKLIVSPVVKLHQHRKDAQKRHMANFLMQQVFGSSKKTSALLH